uniref:Uncharacterized protein n=1 Tax=Arundo donax TaxID=35708 RepID=A0A0A9FIS9_ARUDO
MVYFCNLGMNLPQLMGAPPLRRFELHSA